MADITGTAKHLSITSLVHMGLRLTLEYLRSKSGARVHASIHWNASAHRNASFYPRNGSPRLHVLTLNMLLFYSTALVHSPWYPVLCHGVVGVYTVRHGPHRSILDIYRLGQRIWPAMKRISSLARTFLNGGCPTLSNILLNPCRKMERMQVCVSYARSTGLLHDAYSEKVPPGAVCANVADRDGLIHWIFLD